VRWKFQAAYTPLELDVEQGKVYMLAILLNSSNQLAVFYALNASTGAQQWQYPKDPNTPVSISLVGADNNAAYLITSSNQNSSMTNSALALKADDGTELWHYQLTAQYHNFDSSALDGGVVYLGANDGNLYALNASDGKLRWQTQVGHSYTSVELVNGDMIYVAILQEGFVAVNSKDGSMRWRYQSGASMQAVAVENGLLYGVLSNNGFSSDPDSYAVAFNTADGTIFWKYDNGQTPFFPVVG
jgi:outer membrane protein assembly factor BamB